MRNGTIAALLVVAILAGAGAGYLAGFANERIVTSVSTSTTTFVSTLTQTTTISVTTNGNTQASECTTITFAGYGTPAPTEPWFTAGVNYTGPWEADATVYNNGSPIFSACYTGDNTDGGMAQFIYQNASLTNSSTIRIIATKLDGSTTTLYVACNGYVNSTISPYGSVTLFAPVDNAVTS